MYTELQIFPHNCYHCEITCQPAHDIGNRLGGQNAVDAKPPQMRKEQDQGNAQNRFPKQGEKYGLFCFHRYTYMLSKSIPGRFPDLGDFFNDRQRDSFRNPRVIPLSALYQRAASPGTVQSRWPYERNRCNSQSHPGCTGDRISQKIRFASI